MTLTTIGRFYKGSTLDYSLIKNEIELVQTTKDKSRGVAYDHTSVSMNYINAFELIQNKLRFYIARHNEGPNTLAGYVPGQYNSSLKSNFYISDTNITGIKIQNFDNSYNFKYPSWVKTTNWSENIRNVNYEVSPDIKMDKTPGQSWSEFGEIQLSADNMGALINLNVTNPKESIYKPTPLSVPSGFPNISTGENIGNYKNEDLKWGRVSVWVSLPTPQSTESQIYVADEDTWAWWDVTLLPKTGDKTKLPSEWISDEKNIKDKITLRGTNALPPTYYGSKLQLIPDDLAGTFN